jgi:type IV pilus assembly protein PilA
MSRREDGFTLIELLVVILLIGALVAMALPSFINQSGKARDAEAKNNLLVAARAMETYFVEHKTYSGANMNPSSDPDSLLALEPTLSDAPMPSITAQDIDSYTLRAVSASQTPVTFRLQKQSSGKTDHDCSPASTGGCNATGTW